MLEREEDKWYADCRTPLSEELGIDFGGDFGGVVEGYVEYGEDDEPRQPENNDDYHATYKGKLFDTGYKYP